jgi:hypothetical protein
VVMVLEQRSGKVLAKSAKPINMNVTAGNTMLTHRGNAVFALLPDGTINGLFPKLKV